MIKMKKEEIDNLIAESFKTMSEDLLGSFVDYITDFSQILNESGLDKHNRSIATYCLACIQTARVNSINTMREVLYKLCCENDSTEK